MANLYLDLGKQNQAKKLDSTYGYDPESKGKVEAGVKYVKSNCLYGETFENWSALEQHVAT